jgi:uncharacterized membrane protein YhaH (DUF805 family)
MQNMNWAILPYQRYFDFGGRSRRMEYWLYQLMWLVVLVAIVLICEALGFGKPEGSDDIHPVGLLLMGIWIVVNIIPSFAVTVRRWHDLGQSGWFVLLFGVLCAIPLVGLIPALGNVIWFLMPGVADENRWGPNPKQI